MATQPRIDLIGMAYTLSFTGYGMGTGQMMHLLAIGYCVGMPVSTALMSSQPNSEPDLHSISETLPPLTMTRSISLPSLSL
jgi:hypothetical protein